MAAILYDRQDIEEKPNSRLVRVVVSRDRARVCRRLATPPGRGVRTVYFNALGRGIEENNIKARLTAPGARILSVALEKRNLYFFNKEENEKLAGETAAALKSLIGLFDRKSVLAVEAGLIGCLRDYLERALGDVLLEQNIAIARLKEALDFLRELLDRNREEAVVGEREEEQALEHYQRLSALLAKAGRLDRKETHRIRVELEGEGDAETEIEVLYTVPGVAWRMAYDAALQTAEKKLTLSVYGEISQSTGEDWDGAEIVLSSVESVMGIEIPVIHPVRLCGYEEKIKPDVMTVDEEIQESPGAGGDEPLPRETASAIPEKTGTAYAFTVSQSPMIPSDGLWHRFLIRRDQCAPVLSWETAPALMEYVYLKAVFPNRSGAPLLPGRVMIYRNGSYIGATATVYRAAEEECALSFGIDLDIKVKRIVLRDRYLPPKGLVTRAKREFAYRYVLSHFKEEPVTLVLKEPVHLSEVEKVKVKIEEDTTPGYQRDREGILSFTTTVPAGKFVQTLLKLHYTLEGPASYGLERV
jgi:uncharacterized protein (TIGR02231 family)